MSFSVKVAIGLLLGTAFGLFLNVYGVDTPWVTFILENIFKPLYKVFLQGLFMVVVPLVFCYIVLGVTNLKSGKALSIIGGRLIIYYGLHSIMALIIGHVIVLWIQPGSIIDPQIPTTAQEAFASNVE